MHLSLRCYMSLIFAAVLLPAAPQAVSFSQSQASVDAYAVVEVEMRVSAPDAANPFTEVTVEADFGLKGSPRLTVDGFCDSPDGSLYRVRFMPAKPGEYEYSIRFRQGAFEKTHSGAFRAVDGRRRGILRVDSNYPWHFLWEGTGEHYFWNGTTAFLVMGWQDEATIRGIIDRLNRLQVNRMRVMLAARVTTFWGEPVTQTAEFRTCLNPWVSPPPQTECMLPAIDYTRFNVAYWQKVERMLQYAWTKDMSISAVLDWNDSRVHPVAGSEDELRYFRYAVARLAAFSNINWDLGDDITAYHDDAWAHLTGRLLKKWDVYRHLATNHPNSDREPLDRASDWMDYTSFQSWRRPQHERMLAQRRKQEQMGRIIPQTNEEYGYEDHYPRGSSFGYPDLQSADANRREAWGIAMAGTYQTTGETAKRGTGVWPDTGGGWINGRGDDSMVMLNGMAHMVDFFTSFEWWKLDPHDDLVDEGAYCLAAPGQKYALYLRTGRPVTVRLAPGEYEAEWFNPRTGKRSPAGTAKGPAWKSPASPDSADWALLLTKR